MKIEIDVNRVGQCPYWVENDGTCKHFDGPSYCTNESGNKPCGHCPFLKTDQESNVKHVWLDDWEFSDCWK